MPDDYIKRDDALKVLCDKCVFESHCSRENEFCNQIQGIKAITAADVAEVRHGRWVKMTGMMPPEFTGHYQCSECGWFCKKHSIKETDFDFCPGCGADMRKRRKLAKEKEEDYGST